MPTYLGDSNPQLGRPSLTPEFHGDSNSPTSSWMVPALVGRHLGSPAVPLCLLSLKFPYSNQSVGKGYPY